LLRFQQFKEKNLLILGQTGVGKSTWINALANQITFQTMDEALQVYRIVERRI
jgi:putative ribosome biogenesis GTPase RsgA